MPLSSGMSIHDDTKHKGSAKRDVVNGVAALDAGGALLAPGPALSLTRNTSNNILIRERTSGEHPIYFTRIGPDDFEVLIMSGGGYRVVQLANMKDAANGIAGLDASAKVPDSLLEYPILGHGPTLHTDVTRKIFMPANEAYILSGASSHYGYAPTVEGGANVDEPIMHLSMYVPDDFVSFTSVKLLWLSTVASGNMDWDMAGEYAAGGEVYNTHSDTPANGISATGGAMVINFQEAPNPLTLSSLSAGNFLSLRATRWGSLGSDTINAAVHFLGLVFEYIADQ